MFPNPVPLRHRRRRRRDVQPRRPGVGDDPRRRRRPDHEVRGVAAERDDGTSFTIDGLGPTAEERRRSSVGTAIVEVSKGSVAGIRHLARKRGERVRDLEAKAGV